MIGYLAKAYGKICSILAIVNLCVTTGVAIPLGIYTADYFIFDPPLSYVVIVGVSLFGLLVGFVFDVLVFGLAAQLVEIRKLLEEIKNK